MLSKKTKKEIEKIVQSFIADNGFKKPEADVQTNYTVPLLELLGWKSGQRKINTAQVVKTRKFPDILLLSPSGATLFVVESKRPKADLATNSFRKQLTDYCDAEGVYWGTLTNFFEWRIFSTRQGLYDFNGFDVIRLCDPKTNEILLDDGVWRMLERLQASFLSQKNGQIDSNKVYYPEKEEIRDEFFTNLKNWRKSIAKELKNKIRDTYKRNLETQKILDRLIFIKVCFDKKVIPQNYLSAILYSKRNKYLELRAKFQELNNQFDSSLFSHDLCDDVTLTDKLVEKVIKELNRIDFSNLNVHVIGEVYEDYLGELLSDKKKQGTYYTPEFIVQDIVENTLGKRLKKVKSLKELRKISVLDLACGSGSFLIGAFDTLYKKYRSFYGKKIKPETDFKIKREILLNNLYGVDLDQRAVEIAQLNLLLKAIEGSNINEIKRKRLLPDLSYNIRCGNALIGENEEGLSHFATELSKLSKLKSKLRKKQLGDGITEVNLIAAKAEIDENEKDISFEINKNLSDYFENPNDYSPFSFKLSFHKIFQTGGFDVIVGNPPYVRQETFTDIKPYLEGYYDVYHGVADLSVYFIERGISFIKDIGYWGVIVSNKWLRTNYGEPLRKWLKEKQILEITDIGDLQVFEKATTYPCNILAGGDGPIKRFNAAVLREIESKKFRESIKNALFPVELEELSDEGWTLIRKEELMVIKKIKKIGVPLGDYVEDSIYYGIKTGLNKAFVINDSKKRELINEHSSSKEIIKPFLEGKDVKRYSNVNASKNLIMVPKGWTRSNLPKGKSPWSWFRSTYPAIARHLEKYKKKAQARSDQGEYWWELRACDYYNKFKKSKIVYPNICKHPEFTFDSKKNFTNQKCFIIPTSDKYLLGVLNSSTFAFLFRKILPRLRGGFVEPSYVILKEFPIPILNLSVTAEKKNHNKMLKLVDQMLSLNKKLAKVNSGEEQKNIETEIRSVNKQINKLVYKLYGLTKKEIAIVERVEEAMKPQVVTPKTGTKKRKKKTLEEAKVIKRQLKRARAGKRAAKKSKD